MTSVTFEGEVNSLSINQRVFICDVLHSRCINANKVRIETVGIAGDNYIANVKRITVIRNDESNFKMIAKVAPTHEVARARSGIPILFRNEIVMYLELLPKLLQLQKSAGIPEKEHFKFAECYGALQDAPHEMILLEDLQLSNFVILDRFEPLTNNIVMQILKKIAVLHSLSMVMKRKDSNTFQEVTSKLTDLFAIMSKVKNFELYLAGVKESVLNALDSDKYKSVIKKTYCTHFGDLDVFLEDVVNLQHAVVIQGDGWTNNIMFQFEYEEAVNCIMIDYQLSKVSNPVYDLLYVIFNCTDHKTRCVHYHEWIDYYHTELEKSLLYFGINIESVFPKEQLHADLKRYSKLLFTLSLMMSSLLIRKTDDAAKVKEAIETGESFESTKDAFVTTNLDDESINMFKNRVEGLIDSYRYLRYID